MNLRDKLIHGNNAVYLCVLAWWIASMWFDEPGAATAAEAESEPAEGEAVAAEAVEESESHPKSAGTDAHN